MNQRNLIVGGVSAVAPVNAAIAHSALMAHDHAEFLDPGMLLSVAAGIALAWCATRVFREVRRGRRTQHRLRLRR